MTHGCKLIIESWDEGRMVMQEEDAPNSEVMHLPPVSQADAQTRASWEQLTALLDGVEPVIGRTTRIAIDDACNALPADVRWSIASRLAALLSEVVEARPNIVIVWRDDEESDLASGGDDTGAER